MYWIGEVFGVVFLCCLCVWVVVVVEFCDYGGVDVGVCWVVEGIKVLEFVCDDFFVDCGYYFEFVVVVLNWFVCCLCCGCVFDEY